MFTQKRKRGRPAKNQTAVPVVTFDVSSIKMFRGNELSFSNELFKPIKTHTEVDTILSTDGGLMPGTNMVLVGGPGSGKSTLALDWMSEFTNRGYKCLFVSGEMDEIAHYKYCKRLPKFGNVKTLFLKNYSENVMDVLEHVFNEGYDVIAIDSIAEVIEMVKDNCRMSEGAAESWFLGLQDRMKKGDNKGEYYTTFLNIQQVTKAGEFAGSNRLKHMTDAMAHIERSKDGTQRSIYFSKNRDCDKDDKMYFVINNDIIHYTYGSIE